MTHSICGYWMKQSLMFSRPIFYLYSWYFVVQFCSMRFIIAECHSNNLIELKLCAIFFCYNKNGKQHAFISFELNMAVCRLANTANEFLFSSLMLFAEIFSYLRRKWIAFFLQNVWSRYTDVNSLMNSYANCLLINCAPYRIA